METLAGKGMVSVFWNEHIDYPKNEKNVVLLGMIRRLNAEIVVRHCTLSKIVGKVAKLHKLSLELFTIYRIYQIQSATSDSYQ